MRSAAKRVGGETAPAAKPERETAGVVYFDLAAGGAAVRMFRCDPLRANLTPRGCRDRWLTAQAATGAQAEGLSVCRGCPIGAAHAGEKAVHYSWLYGQAICPRCSANLDAEQTEKRPGGRRMIGDRLCVSCYNRGRELLAERNARGNRPVKLLAARPREFEITRLVDGEADHVRDSAVGVLELMVQALRTTKGAVGFARRAAPVRYTAGRRFAFSGSTVGLRQGRLF